MKGVFRYLNNAVNADDYDAKIAHDDLPKNKRVNFIRCITLLYLLLQICKFNLISFCPHDLFPNTKADIGPCEKRHEDYLKE